MAAEHYLDTARLGQMCQGARLAEQDFCWLVSQPESLLYLERFLTEGFSGLPPTIRSRLPGLSIWAGVKGLGDSLGKLIGQPQGLPNYLFAQSSSLITFAVNAIFSTVDRVLTTDLDWPLYVQALRQAAVNRKRHLFTVNLRQTIERDHATADDVLEVIREAYVANRCEGIFLSDITFSGIALPVERAVAKLKPRFVVVDGAQAFNHRPVDLSSLGCDIYLAGTHKWLGAFHPLRIAFVGRSRNRRVIEELASSTTKSSSCDELFRFHRELTVSEFCTIGSTVNISALICAAGAVDHASKREPGADWRILRSNSNDMAYWLPEHCCEPLLRHPSLRSGILRVAPKCGTSTSARDFRRLLMTRRLAATSYKDGTIRLSMPRQALTLEELGEIGHAVYSAVRH